MGMSIVEERRMKEYDMYAEKEIQKEELTDGQKLFISLLKGDDKDIEDKLYHYVYGVEYGWAHEGGEPDLGEIQELRRKLEK